MEYAPLTIRWDRAPRPHSPARFPSILYRVSFFFALLLTIAFPVHAQDDKPIVKPTDRRAPKKKDSSPRAIAVLQMTANGKASLLPIAILVDGKFWDATAYKADPVPMALESGNVYEGERAGSSLGLFTIGSALHSNAANAPFPWLGTGTWRPGEAVPTNVPLKAETAPVGIDTTYDPPRLTKNPGAAKQPAPAAPPSTSPPSQPSDPDAPPRLTKSDSSANSNSAPPPASTPTPPQKSSDPDAPPHLNRPVTDSQQTAPSKPTDAKPAETKTDADTSAASDSGASESGRPRLRRGKPPASTSFDDFPGYSPLATKLTTAPAKTYTSPTEKSVIVDMVPAISDANGPEPHSFRFTWLKDEEPDRRKQMLDLAKAQLSDYLGALAKNTTSASSASKPATRRTPPPKPKPIEPIFDNIQMRAYDVWNSNVPIIILSAEAHMPPAKTPGKTAPQPAPNTDLRYSVLVVAYPDIYQNLHKLFARVTDKFHLDISPRLELVDAVDADGDTRGELLFKETTDSASGWILYRPTQDKLWKLFDSLNPE